MRVKKYQTSTISQLDTNINIVSIYLLLGAEAQLVGKLYESSRKFATLN